MLNLHPAMLYEIALLFVLTYFDSPQLAQAAAVSDVGSTTHRCICTYARIRNLQLHYHSNSSTNRPFPTRFPL